MDKEDVAQIYNEILLNHIMNRNWVICSEVDGPRDCHTEWSKSEREEQIPYANTYICNLKKKHNKWSWWTYGLDENKTADIENGLEDKGRGNGKLGWSERVALTYTLPNVK